MRNNDTAGRMHAMGADDRPPAIISHTLMFGP